MFRKSTASITHALFSRNPYTLQRVYSVYPHKSQLTAMIARHQATQSSRSDSGVNVQNIQQDSNQNTSGYRLDGVLLGYWAIAVSGTLAWLYAFQDYLAPRETQVLEHAIDLKKDSHHGYIVDSNRYEFAGDKPCGELSGSIVKDKETGTLYLKKGAASKDALIKEFIIAKFLGMVRPEQPSSLIMEEKHIDGSARFFTLSEIYPDSMDLNAFVSAGNYKAKLEKKPLVGFEISLASDMAFAKQADMKLANYVVFETADAHVVISIDHEMSGKGVHPKRVFTTDLSELISHVRDISEATLLEAEDNPALFVSVDEASNFLNYVHKFMDPDKVMELYKKIAEVDSGKINAIIGCIGGKDNLISIKESAQYTHMINELIGSAREFCAAHHERPTKCGIRR